MRKLRKAVKIKALANNDGTPRGKSCNLWRIYLSLRKKREGRERGKGLISPLVAIYFAFRFVIHHLKHYSLSRESYFFLTFNMKIEKKRVNYYSKILKLKALTERNIY